MTTRNYLVDPGRYYPNALANYGGAFRRSDHLYQYQCA